MEILKIEWSKEAIISLENILNYIELNFGNSIALQYYKNVETTLLQIQNFPYLGKKCKNKLNLRSIVINKRTTLYYSLTEKKIQLLEFFDNRQYPEKNHNLF